MVRKTNTYDKNCKDHLYPAATIDMEKGRRTLTFVVDSSKREETGLRVELVPVPGSSAKFQPEGGI